MGGVGRQGLDGADGLPRHAEGFAAGGQDLDAGALGEEALGELGGGFDDVLAVVEHEQQPAVGAVLDEAGCGVGGGRRGRGFAGDEGVLAQAEGAEDGAGDGGGVVEAGEFDEPAGLGVGCGGVFGEACLSRTAGSGEGDEAQPGQVAVEGGQFGLAADEGVQAGAEVAPGGLRAGGRDRLRPDRGPGNGLGGLRERGGRLRERGGGLRERGGRLRVPAGGTAGGRARRSRRDGRGCLGCLLVRRGLRRQGPGPEQFRVQGGEFGPGVGAEAVAEGAARALVRGEGVGGTAGRLQGAQLLGPQRLVVRALVDQRLDLRQEQRRGGGAAEQVRLDASAQGGRAVGLGGGGVCGTGGLRQVGEGRAAPEREGGAQGAGGGLRVGGQFPVAVGGEAGEAVEVDVVAGGGQEVAAGGGGGDGVPAAEGTAKAGDEGLEGGGGVQGRGVAPDVVDKFGDGGGTAGAQGEGGEERAQPGAADREGGAGLVVCLGDAEDEVPHAPILPGRAVGGGGMRRAGARPGRRPPGRQVIEVSPPASRRVRRAWASVAQVAGSSGASSSA